MPYNTYQGQKASRATVQKEKSDLVADLTELRTQFIALLAKLDGDGGTAGTDFESTLTPAALASKV